jgi:hypothetical protein
LKLSSDHFLFGATARKVMARGELQINVMNIVKSFSNETLMRVSCISVLQ